MTAPSPRPYGPGASYRELAAERTRRDEPLPPLDLLELVSDLSFLAATRIALPKPSLHDPKPSIGLRGCSPTQIRRLTRCQSCGMSPYTPVDLSGRRVCGYCRGLILRLRRDRHTIQPDEIDESPDCPEIDESPECPEIAVNPTPEGVPPC